MKRGCPQRDETLAFHDVSKTFVEYFTRKTRKQFQKIACNDPSWKQSRGSGNKIPSKLRLLYVT